MGMTTGKTTKAVYIGALMGMLTLATACAPVLRYHGFNPPPEDMEAVQVGQTSRAELETIFGPPTSEGLLDNDDYYYVSSTFRHFGPLAPEEIARQVLVVSFNADDTVGNVARYGLEDGQVVVLDRRVTDNGVVDFPFLRQLLGSFGNFNAGALLDDDL